MGLDYRDSSITGIEEDLDYSMSRYCADSEDHETPAFYDDIEVSDAGTQEHGNVNKKCTLSNESKCLTVRGMGEENITA